MLAESNCLTVSTVQSSQVTSSTGENLEGFHVLLTELGWQSQLRLVSGLVLWGSTIQWSLMTHVGP